MKFNVGDSFTGFKFEDDGHPGYDIDMDEYIGVVGEILYVDTSDGTAKVLFPDGQYWWYPIDNRYIEKSPDAKKYLKEVAPLQSLKIAAYGVVSLKDGSVFDVVDNRDKARQSLRDVKSIWPEEAKSFKIVKLKADKFIR